MVIFALFEGALPPKPRIVFWRAGPLYHRLPSLGGCSRIPSVSVYQLALSERLHLTSVNFFWKTLSARLPISWWVICQRVCSPRTECTAVFAPRQHDSCAHAAYSPHLALSDSSVFPWMKKPSKGVLLMWKR